MLQGILDAVEEVAIIRIAVQLLSDILMEMLPADNMLGIVELPAKTAPLIVVADLTVPCVTKADSRYLQVTKHTDSCDSHLSLLRCTECCGVSTPDLRIVAEAASGPDIPSSAATAAASAEAGLGDLLP